MLALVAGFIAGKAVDLFEGIIDGIILVQEMLAREEGAPPPRWCELDGRNCDGGQHPRCGQ